MTDGLLDNCDRRNIGQLSPTFVLILFNGLVPEQGRDPNVSTPIRIATVLWDQIIKSLCVCGNVCVIVHGLVPEQGVIRM